MNAEPPPHPPRQRWVFWSFVAIAGFFLLTEHTAHVLGALPYLLLLACPLMHLFMHHDHRHHHHGARQTEQDREEQR